MKDKEILVTGGAGFIGSNLVKALCGNNSVTVVDDLSEGHEANLSGLGVVFFKEDVRNAEFVSRLFKEKKFDAVFHLAASFANQKSIERPDEDLEINGIATLRLLEYALENKVSRFVYSSSSCVYGPVEGAMTEEMKPLPETPYAITKLLGEYYANFFCEYHKLPVSVVRFFNVYGPCEYPGKYRNVIPKFLDKALRGEPLTITGTGGETRDFTFVEDAVAGTILAAEKPEAIGQVFNLGSGRETTVLELAEAVNEAAGNTAGINFVPRRGWDGIARRLSSIARARTELGYVPKTPLQEGLKKTCAWLKDVQA